MNLFSSLQSKPNLKKILTNLSWLFFDKVLRMGVGGLVAIWMARYLGPEDFGLLNYTMAFAAIFMSIANLGLDGLVVREIVRNSNDITKYLSVAFILKIIFGIISYGLCLITYFNFHSSDSFTLVILSIVSLNLLFQAFDVLELYFQAKVQSRLSVLAKNIAFIISVIIKIYLIVNNYPLIYYAVISSFELFLGAIFLVMVFKFNSLSTFKLKWDKIIAVNFIKEGVPLIFSSIVVTIYMKIDQVMLKEMSGEVSVGIYSAAVKISEIFYFIPIIICSSIFPSILNSKETDSKEYLNKLKKLYGLMVWMGICIGVVFTFSSEYIILNLFGESYKEASGVLMIHIWSSTFVFLGVATSQFLIAEGLTKISFYRTLIGAILNIILNLFLIPVLGVNGAALATLISYGVATFTIVFFKQTNYQCILIFESILLPFNYLNEKK